MFYVKASLGFVIAMLKTALWFVTILIIPPFIFVQCLPMDMYCDMNDSKKLRAECMEKHKALKHKCRSLDSRSAEKECLRTGRQKLRDIY